MNTRTFTRIGAGLLATAATIAVALSASSVATAETVERTLRVTRVDGSPVGTLFTEWVMVPGDKVTTTVVAHRAGPGESSLLVTLGDLSENVDAPPTPVEEDVIITARVNGLEVHSSAAALMKGDAVLDLGRSGTPTVPIDITFELPFESGNASMQASLALSVVVTAADIPVGVPTPMTPATPTNPSTPANPAVPAAPGTPATAPNHDSLASVLPFLPNTGASARELLILAALASTTGLLFLGGKRKTPESRKAH